MNCSSGKTAYPTPQAAWSAVTSIRRRVRSKGKGTGQKFMAKRRPYRCDRCHQWHLTAVDPDRDMTWR
jgi:hypothetical protein